MKTVTIKNDLCGMLSDNIALIEAYDNYLSGLDEGKRAKMMRCIDALNTVGAYAVINTSGMKQMMLDGFRTSFHSSNTVNGEELFAWITDDNDQKYQIEFHKIKNAKYREIDDCIRFITFYMEDGKYMNIVLVDLDLYDITHYMTDVEN